eukprot:1609916-Amphidinium_carterae.1
MLNCGTLEAADQADRMSTKWRRRLRAVHWYLHHEPVKASVELVLLGPKAALQCSQSLIVIVCVVSVETQHCIIGGTSCVATNRYIAVRCVRLRAFPPTIHNLLIDNGGLGARDQSLWLLYDRMAFIASLFNLSCHHALRTNLRLDSMWIVQHSCRTGSNSACVHRRSGGLRPHIQVHAVQ